MASSKYNESESAVENQITELRSQIAELSRSVSDRAGNLGDRAQEYADEARGGIRRAASVVKEQGANVVEAVRENPGTATSVLTVVGLLGFAIGYCIGQQNQPQAAKYFDRWR
jgi:ElaB/YqjD/DUF883 family membrane-anchored ribosome-binding protein